jgi:type III restriction enzyme
MYVLETKGDQLDNLDTAYKRKQLAQLYDCKKIKGIVKNTELDCLLILESEWKAELSKLLVN